MPVLQEIAGTRLIAVACAAGLALLPVACAKPPQQVVAPVQAAAPAVAAVPAEEVETAVQAPLTPRPGRLPPGVIPEGVTRGPVL